MASTGVCAKLRAEITTTGGYLKWNSKDMHVRMRVIRSSTSVNRVDSRSVNREGIMRPTPSLLRTAALCAFFAILAFFLLSEHQAHLFGILPYLLLLACPLLHLFLHRRHGGHEEGPRSVVSRLEPPKRT